MKDVIDQQPIKRPERFVQNLSERQICANFSCRLRNMKLMKLILTYCLENFLDMRLNGDLLPVRLEHKARCRNQSFLTFRFTKIIAQCIYCGRSRVGARDARPLSVQFLSISCSFRQKSCQIIGERPTLGVGASWEILDP